LRVETYIINNARNLGAVLKSHAARQGTTAILSKATTTRKSEDSMKL
jgi:hypothetical protein